MVALNAVPVVPDSDPAVNVGVAGAAPVNVMLALPGQPTYPAALVPPAPAVPVLVPVEAQLAEAVALCVVKDVEELDVLVNQDAPAPPPAAAPAELDAEFAPPPPPPVTAGLELVHPPPPPPPPALVVLLLL